MNYASVCDGIGAAHCAWSPLGWRCAWSSEIDPFPSAVVDHHWRIPNLGDMTRITDGQTKELGRIDLLVGGTPCQSFSVAGLRKGLADPRGNLALVYLGLADRLRPEWLVWENVPGVLSSNKGRDFGSFVGGLAELGYGWAYRVLDAQFVRVESHPYAVPQRRRRVFVIGYLGDWRRAAAVLLERHGLRGDHPPRSVAGQGFAADAAPSLVASGRGVERTGETRGQDPVVAATLDARKSAGGFPGSDGAFGGHVVAVSHALRGEGFDASEDGTGRGTPIIAQPFEVGNCLTRRMHKGINTTCDEGQTPIIAGIDPYNGAEYDQAAGSLGVNCGVSTGRNGVRVDMAVRRLTPRECERLQGFPDDYTLIDYRGKPAADGPRYKALGNSMAVNVMSWIGQRIEAEAKP